MDRPFCKMNDVEKSPHKVGVVPDRSAYGEKFSGWTFLTNHTHVIVCLTRDSAVTVRSLALQIGITERSVQRILAELEEGGVIKRTKKGRCNLYEINSDFELRHPLEAHHTIGDLMRTLA